MTTLKQLLDLLSNYEIVDLRDNDNFATNEEEILYFGNVRNLLESEIYKKYENENVFEIMSGEYYENNVRFTKLYVLLDLSRTFVEGE